MGFLYTTPIRTFVLIPLITLVSELIINKGTLDFDAVFLPLMIWGYAQYRLCGFYRTQHGGGGPGINRPPQNLVSTGPYAYTRNPMYLGHLIFLIGLTLTFNSSLAAIITVAMAVWFHLRVLGDEAKLTQRLGEPYVDYTKTVKRWIPGLL